MKPRVGDRNELDNSILLRGNEDGWCGYKGRIILVGLVGS